MRGQNKNVSQKNIILSLAPSKSYDQIQATIGKNFNRTSLRRFEII
jgi:hypothetical protein